MKILAIVHQPDAGPGVFAETIRAAEGQLDLWPIARNQVPPRPPRSYDAVITLGGAMHVDQEAKHAWLAAEKQLLAELIRDRVPVLAVCLGAQLLAEAAGGTASRAPVPEIGWYEVKTTPEAAGDPLLGPLAPGFQALEWHSYEFSLPPTAVALATSANCLQGFRVGAAWGIQFHAEVRAADFDAWIDDYRSDPDAVALGVQPEEMRARSGPALEGWNELGRRLCARFLHRARALAAAGRD